LIGWDLDKIDKGVHAYDEVEGKKWTELNAKHEAWDRELEKTSEREEEEEESREPCSNLTTVSWQPSTPNQALSLSTTSQALTSFSPII
jgi:hypothetical protein